MSTLHTDLKSGAAILTLNRPSRANSFNFEMTTALMDALSTAENDPQVRCVVITGGGKVFSAGQDITEMKQGGGVVSYREHLEKTYNPLILQIRRMGKP
ncbi:MAG TPA: enoyl-CoA hydratase/isomerase family protein, partial [Anaerolineales bacterium]|nr:enoyl-CoA hydratase/isomerase family protein [Anaerolineales bacterium]